MFMDFRDQPPPSRWEPRPPPRPAQLTARQARILGWLVAINVLGLLIAPIGGASIFAVAEALLH